MDPGRIEVKRVWFHSIRHNLALIQSGLIRSASVDAGIPRGNHGPGSRPGPTRGLPGACPGPARVPPGACPGPARVRVRPGPARDPKPSPGPKKPRKQQNQPANNSTCPQPNQIQGVGPTSIKNESPPNNNMETMHINGARMEPARKTL